MHGCDIFQLYRAANCKVNRKDSMYDWMYSNTNFLLMFLSMLFPYFVREITFICVVRVELGVGVIF